MTGPRDTSKLSCEEFHAMLPELIGTGEDISTDPHIQSCELCRRLLAELETIAEAARQLFPAEEEPPDKIWSQIESALKEEENSTPNSRGHVESAVRAAGSAG
ncbi:MAG: hypothetical protein WBE76_09140 [Terracidiphilus sp.]